jgi:hypothetical protein
MAFATAVDDAAIEEARDENGKIGRNLALSRRRRHVAAY